MFQLNNILKIDPKKINKQAVLIGLTVLLVITTIAVASFKYGLIKALPISLGGASTDAIAKQSVEYINKNLLQQGQSATLVSSSTESGLVKFTIKVADQTFDSYATKDGKLIFPQAIKTDSNPDQQNNSGSSK